MSQLEEVPPINPWPFILGDAALLSTAFFIGWKTPAPHSPVILLLVALCVIAGCVLAAIPFILNYTRRQDLALDERQRAIAAIAHSTGNSAEQLSIALTGLHTLTESLNKALKHADHLPAKIQERIHEFQDQLNTATLTENEALAQEVETLRSAETERLESALTALQKTATQLTALEKQTREHLESLTQTLAHHHESLSASSATHQKSHTTALADLQSARDQAAQTLRQTLDGALADLDHRLAALTQRYAQRLAETASLPQRASLPPAAESALATTPTAPLAPEPPPPLEPPSALAPELPPVVPTTPPAPAAAPASPAPRRSVRKPAPVEATLDLGLLNHDDSGQSSPEDNQPTTALSSDGKTRLIVTAYIGIGNRLFARGEGPGLDPEKGMPLQFVSIGKWRWETPDASAPVRLNLFKNDSIPCSNHSEITIEPGQQHELSATF